MKTRLAVILVLIAVLALAAALLVRSQGPRPSPPAGPSPPPETPALAPSAVVVGYLEALYRKDFSKAYSYLSAGSREAHPYDEFLSLCEKGEATNYDLASARELPAEGGRVTVAVPLVEDPAEAAFTTVEEAGSWKVVFTNGVPWFPYP
jgi:hypothetical protein